MVRENVRSTTHRYRPLGAAKIRCLRGGAGDDASLAALGAAVVVVVVLVAVEFVWAVLWPVDALFSGLDFVDDGGLRQAFDVSVAGTDLDAQGRPFRSVMAWVFVPGLPQSTRLGQVPVAARLRVDVDRVGRRPQSVDGRRLSESVTGCGEQGVPGTGVGPDLESVVAGGPGYPKAFRRYRQAQTVRSMGTRAASTALSRALRRRPLP